MPERVADLEQPRAERRAPRDEVADDQAPLLVEREADADAHLLESAGLARAAAPRVRGESGAPRRSQWDLVASGFRGTVA